MFTHYANVIKSSGQLVTDCLQVGSALELEQRLAEDPKQLRFKARSGHRLPLPPPGPARTLHEFKIRDTEDVQQVWQKLQQTSGIGALMPKPEDLEIQNPQAATGKKLLLEDFRRHHFDTTNPPMLSQAIPANSQTKRSSSLHNPMSDTVDASLTSEGKRQAQSAGYRLRARGTPFQSPYKIMAPSDQSFHHDRWASYQKNKGSQPFRSKGGEVRDSESSAKVHPSDHLEITRSQSVRGQTKPLAARPVSIGSEVPANLGDGSDLPSSIEKTPRTKASLLDLFETELAKNLTPIPTEAKVVSFKSQADDTEKPEPPSGSFAALLDFANAPTNVADQVNEPGSTTCEPSGSNISEPQEPLLEVETTDVTPDAVEKGIRTAVAGFESCIRGLFDAAQAAQTSPESSAIRPENLLSVLGKLAESLATKGSQADKKDDLPKREVSQDNLNKAQSANQSLAPQVPSRTCAPASSSEELIALELDRTKPQEKHPSEPQFVNPVIPKSTIPHQEPKRKQTRFAQDQTCRLVQVPLPTLSHQRSSRDWPGSATNKNADIFEEPNLFKASQICKRSDGPGFPNGIEQHIKDLATTEDDASSSTAACRFPTLDQFERNSLEQDRKPPHLPSVGKMPPRDNAGYSSTSEPRKLPSKQPLPPPPKYTPNYVRNRRGAYASSKSRDPPAPYVNPYALQKTNSGDLRRWKSLNLPSDRHFQNGQNKGPAQKSVIQNFQELAPQAQLNSMRLFQESMQRNERSGEHSMSSRIPPATVVPSANPLPRQNQDFFRNAVGVGPRPLSDATLTEPFDASDNDPVTHAQRQEGLRRSATIADLRRSPLSRLRRPYSEHFDHNESDTWNSNTGTSTNRATPSYTQHLRDLSSISGESRPSTTEHRPRPPMWDTSTVDSVPWNSTTWDASPQQAPRASFRPLAAAAAAAPRVPAHLLPESKIQSCVEHLIQLGLDRCDPDRLLTYAQATAGDINEAIDMAMEDKEAADARLLRDRYRA